MLSFYTNILRLLVRLCKDYTDQLISYMIKVLIVVMIMQHFKMADLNLLHEWSICWQLKFNISKCKQVATLWTRSLNQFH